MKHSVHARLAGLLVLSLFPSLSAAQGVVHVVDRDDRPGTDFVRIGDAVAAAAEGDILLVREGVYAGCKITGKSLVVTAEPGVFVRLLTPEVKDLAADQEVVLRGVRMRGVSGLELRDNQGPILVEDGLFEGSGIDEGRGCDVVNCAAVTFSRCTIFDQSSPFGAGLRVTDSNVTLYGCTVLGGEVQRGHDAFPGIEASGSNLFLAGCTVRAGAGGDGFDAGFPVAECLAGGDGGAGILLDADSLLTYFASTFEGGPGGSEGLPNCPAGQDGAPIDAAPSQVTALEGIEPKVFTMPNPMTSGVPVNALFEGLPGEVVVLFMSTEAQPRYAPLLRGMLVPDLGSLDSRILGVVPPEGVLTVPARVTLPVGQESLGLHVQSLHWSAAGGGVLGTPRAILVLE